jgi:hypothetical protein
MATNSVISFVDPAICFAGACDDDCLEKRLDPHQD